MEARDKYREELINEKSFFEVLYRRLLFIKLQPIIPLEELALLLTISLSKESLWKRLREQKNRRKINIASLSFLVTK